MGCITEPGKCFMVEPGKISGELQKMTGENILLKINCSAVALELLPSFKAKHSSDEENGYFFRYFVQ